MWGMLRLPDAPIEVVVDRWDRRHRSHVAHESTDLVAADVTVVDGIRCTNPARTIVDLGAVAPGLVNAAFDRGRRLGLVQLAEVKALVARVARRGRRGVGAARRLLASWDAVWEKTESEAERRFVELLAAGGLRLPEPQVEVRTPNGWFVARVDFVYRSERLAIWIDGETYHSDSGTFQRDRDQQNTLMGLGYRVYRFTWFDVTRRADWVATTVARALRGGESVLA